MIALEHRMNAVQGHWCDRNDTRVQGRKNITVLKFDVGGGVKAGDEDVNSVQVVVKR